MTEPKLPDEPNPHAKWLREAAKQIAAAGHNGWGNTCLFAADEIDALRSELTSALALAAEREGEIERLKHNLLIETESGKQLGRFVRETDDERIDFRDKLIAANARAEELDKANAGLAIEVCQIRTALMELVDVSDIEWEDLPESEFPQFSARFDAALAGARKFHEDELMLDHASTLESDLAEALAGLHQASFCLRELLPNDADAKMTVGIIQRVLSKHEKGS